MEVSFTRVDRKQIHSLRIKSVDSVKWAELETKRPEIVWDGPIPDCFMEKRPMGLRFSFPTLSAAQEWCVHAAGCAGVTGVLAARTPANDTATPPPLVWEARQGPDLGISEAGEVTYRWSLADPCRVCAQYAHGSLERTACNGDAGRGRPDIDALSLPGCALAAPAIPGAPAPDGDGGSAATAAVTSARVTVRIESPCRAS